MCLWIRWESWGSYLSELIRDRAKDAVPGFADIHEYLQGPRWIYWSMGGAISLGTGTTFSSMGALGGLTQVVGLNPAVFGKW